MGYDFVLIFSYLKVGDFNKMSKKAMRIKLIIIIFIILLFISIAVFFIYINLKLHSQKVYTAQQLGITVILSDYDIDGDGIDDYTDILQGARQYIATKPRYESKYYAGGYPDDGCGVCTDVIWKAYQSAGYNLKGLVDDDIRNNLNAYSTIVTPEPNIDFRRVKTLKTFFDRNSNSLSTDFSNPEEWQAGDIVIFSNHIAVCSDKRNSDGIPFIIHHDGLGAREVNEIKNYTIIGHYRLVLQSSIEKGPTE